MATQAGAVAEAGGPVDPAGGAGSVLRMMAWDAWVVPFALVNDIDVIIRRTLLYASTSAVLLATYVAGVAVAISTLAVVALFQPLRKRMRQAIDRRFYRARHDADHPLDAFASRLRDQVDLDALEAELLAVVGQTVQPAQVSVWLRDGAAPPIS